MEAHARGRMIPLWLALPLASGAGLLLDAGFPDRGMWPLPFIGVGLLLVALIGRSAGGALLVGFVAGATFYLALIQWASLFLGPLPMGALVALQAALFALGCLLISLAYRWLPTSGANSHARYLVPSAIAGLWVLREMVASTWPYGGFSWGRLAMSQSESPFSDLLSWVGLSGVSFLMVSLVALVVEMLSPFSPARWGDAVVPALLTAVLVAIPTWPMSSTGSMRVAAIQGNGPAGYFDDRNDGALLAAQYEATLPVLDRDLDVIVWPEGSTDRSPLDDARTAAVFDRVSRQAGAPLIGWAVTERGGLTYNTQILWQQGSGAVDFYDKRHPVPFGEYVPDREFWRPLAPDLIDLVARDYTPGSADAIFTVDGVPTGINICFDIADDTVLRDSVLEGAQVIFSASNNADFGRTDQSAQQLAIARARAIELGRTVVNVSTVGLTAIIGPDGRTLAQLPWHEPGSIVAEVELFEGLTPAAAAGGWFELAAAGLGVGVLLLAWSRNGVVQRRARTDGDARSGVSDVSGASR